MKTLRPLIFFGQVRIRHDRRNHRKGAVSSTDQCNFQPFLLPLKEYQWTVSRRDIKRWRQRLADISWFMHIVKEAIARQANKEDHCTGRCWEGCFKSKGLLDKAALLSGMVYVELNPIRAGMAKAPETSSHTSIHRRLDMLNKGMPQSPCLESFVGITESAVGIPFRLKDYLASQLR